MIYLSLGQGVRQGLTLYKDIHDNKPPLLYLTAAISENLFWFKAILAFWSLATVGVFYKLTVKLFSKNIKAQKISVIIFALLTTLPLLEGNIVNAELFMIGFTILALLILLTHRSNPKKVFLAGVLFGLGTLFKIPAMFDVPVIIIFWLVTRGLNEWKSIMKDSVIIVLGFVTPILLTFVYYFFAGALTEYIRAAFMQNVGYLSSYRPEDNVKPFYVKNAPLIFRGLVVLIGSALLYLFSKKLSKNFILFTLWLLFGLFAVALSERPYPHYFIQIAAPVALLFTLFFAEKSVEQSLVVLPLALAFLVPVYYKFYYYPTISYYTRFVNFALKNTDKGEYFNSFTQNANRNYELAQFLITSSRKADRVFMYDPDSAVVYALSRRLPPVKFVADYHINEFANKDEVISILKSNPPKFIIVTSGHKLPGLMEIIRDRYYLVQQVQNANIYSRINITVK